MCAPSAKRVIRLAESGGQKQRSRCCHRADRSEWQPSLCQKVSVRLLLMLLNVDDVSQV